MSASPTLLDAALAIIAAALYLSASGRHLMTLETSRQTPVRQVTVLALSAVMVHAIIAILSFGDGSLNLGFYKVSSLILLTMATLSVSTLLFRPIHMLVIVTFPLAAIAVLLNAFAPATGAPLTGLTDGLVLHITLALVAFGVLALATLQAGLVSAQMTRLRQHQTRGLLRMLPPLDLMERMFFELLTAGTFLLTAAIVAGAVFIDDLFAQHIVHKTVLTLVAWVLFSITLVVHWRTGWRIATAVTLMFAGFTCMCLGFFGSKLVLELMI